METYYIDGKMAVLLGKSVLYLGGWMEVNARVWVVEVRTNSTGPSYHPSIQLQFTYFL